MYPDCMSLFEVRREAVSATVQERLAPIWAFLMIGGLIAVVMRLQLARDMAFPRHRLQLLVTPAFPASVKPGQMFFSVAYTPGSAQW